MRKRNLPTKNRKNARERRVGGAAVPPSVDVCRSAPPLSLPMLEHRFNDDLLINDQDRDIARNEYEEIFHVLDYPELRQTFLRYDGVANAAKLWVHRIGIIAVTLAGCALIGSAVTPLVQQYSGRPQWALSALFVAEVGGILGVFIAAGGILIARKKKTWLEARMMAEVIRLWHFQALVCRGKEIDASCNCGGAAGRGSFVAARDRHFRLFMSEWANSPDSHLLELIEDPDAGFLHDDPTSYPMDSPQLGKVFSAYRSTRFRHQLAYASHKLQRHTDRPLSILKWPAALLQDRMQAVAVTCLLGSLMCSVVIVVGHLLHSEVASHIGLPVTIVICLVLTVVARAVQDGLAAPEELQRYRDYAGKVRHLLARFDLAGTPAARLELMAEMERAAFEELRGFLRAQSEARFVL